MSLTYKDVKAAYEARQVLAKTNNPSVTREGDRTFLVGREQHVYSQQEILLKPSTMWSVHGEWDHRIIELYYPPGVSHYCYRNPHKQYIGFVDSIGMQRFYVMPDKGLRLQRDGSSYKVMNAVQDYQIDVDRAAAKEAREPAEKLITFVDNLWYMVDCPPDHERVWYISANLPNHEDTAAWMTYIKEAKFARYGHLEKSTVLQKIRDRYTSQELAYKITPLPSTMRHHNRHWAMVPHLRAAGKLAPFEGPIKKKRERAKRSH
jgi:hypothetical protein